MSRKPAIPVAEAFFVLVIPPQLATIAAMKMSIISNLICRLTAAALVTFAAGCAAPSKPIASTPTAHKPCPSHHHLYSDAVQHFSLCLPNGVAKGNAGALPPGSVLFTGFAVIPHTNLEGKRLAIIHGADVELAGATALGHFTAGGVTFQRARFDEGSAGHNDLHLVYSWKHAGQQVHFDFIHHSVNVLNFPPASRPQEYNRAHQIQISEQVMSTFRRLP